MTKNYSAKYSRDELLAMSPKEFRSIVRRGEMIDQSGGVCRGYQPANLVALPKEYAYDFLLFCTRDPRVSPLLEVTEPGDPCPRLMAPDADLRTDLSLYRVFKNGELVDEPTDVIKYWRDDMVAFLTGTTVGFVWALEAANIKYRIVGVYKTNMSCRPAGCFHGPMAVVCFLIRTHDVVRTVQITSRHPAAHGAAIHIGDPTIIGIKELCGRSSENLFARPVPIDCPEPDEVPMFWPCGFTPQLVAKEAKISLMIMHHKAEVFVTDRLSEELAIM